jgi:hypothetical protein
MNEHEEPRTGHERAERTAEVYGDLLPKPTLTDFLLARIAEDEKEASSYLADLDENPPSVHDMVQVGWIEAGSPERVLAECEAKRRIVATCTGYEWESTNARGYDEVLELLALPYADHPDYREEWKP